MSNWHAAHFNKIAKVLREKRKKIEAKRKEWNYARNPSLDYGEQLLNELTLEFAEYFKKENPEFDTDKFIKASGFRKEV